MHKAHRRLEEIGYELMYLEGQKDPESKKQVQALKREEKMLQQQLEDFYNDPMTSYYGI